VPLQAMLFDLDGTLTQPLLDFPAIKREIGISEDAFILEALEGMTSPERRRAMEIVERHELEASKACRFNDGAGELLAELSRRELRVGIITRNSRRSLRIVTERLGIRYDVGVCRDHAAPKPSPEGLEVALRQMTVAPGSAVYVGDHRIDIEAGRTAGTRTIWVTNGRPQSPRPDADFEVRSPGEIIGLLDTLAAN